MPRFDRALIMLCLSACHAEPAEVLFGLEAKAGSRAAPSVQADAGAQDPTLRVAIDLPNGMPRCGECTEISAHASGGVPPYTYVWSDPTLLGPGPHKVCPNMLTGYLVLVTDARSTVINTASATLQCSAPADSAGAASCIGRAPSDVGVNCSTDGVGLPVSYSFALSQPLSAGIAYSALLGVQTIQASLADGMTFRIYGARTACQPEQLLGKFQLSTSVSTYDACFAPELAYDHIVVVTDGGSVGISVTGGTAFCNTGCLVGD